MNPVYWETFRILAPDALTVILVGIACYTDLRSRRIPNVLILTGLVLGLLINVYISQLPGLWSWAAGFLGGMAILAIPYLLGGMGAGDVKLLGMIGALMGLEFVVFSFLYAALWGGLISLASLIRSGRLRLLWIGIMSRNLKAVLQPPKEASEEEEKQLFIPYGIAIGLGTATALLVRWWL